MLNLVLVYSDGQEEINVPQSWNEVTFEQYLNLVNNDNLTEEGNIDWILRASLLTGISEKNLLQCQQSVILTLFNCISFLLDQEPVINAPVPEDFKNWEIESLEYGQIIAIDKILDNNLKELKEDIGRDPSDDELRKHRLNCAADIIEVATRKRIDKDTVEKGRDIKGESCVNVIGLANFFLLRLGGSDTNTGS